MELKINKLLCLVGRGRNLVRRGEWEVERTIFVSAVDVLDLGFVPVYWWVVAAFLCCE